ncbi:choline/ethanolamine kinase family protein [Microvirga guangxiensis]|uniref:Thiamine kinase n=1 Tax=Microvirga guangxiensis TaxID=549386 RepID=A0A1G5KEW8_9HYPH|nr:choline/ethanolamine kinase family protein [Microvirga guangxiensis]SCY99122.1 Thiamine kinase [Microvirga guangxiensis]
MKNQLEFELGQISADLAEAVPALRGLRLQKIATPLGGLSNSNYRLDLPGGSLVLRVPRSNPGPFLIDRQEEVKAACFAGAAGIGPPVLYANPQGVMLTRFIEEAQPMSIEAYRSDPISVQRTAHVVAQLHRSDLRFKRRFNPFRILDEYRVECRLRSHGLPVLPSRLEAAVEEARAKIMASPVSLVPSHCDLVPENCLDTGSRMVLIDWEYARMNDPAWDLAYLCVEGRLDATQEHLLLASYDDFAVTYGRLQVFKLLTCILNALWGRLQTGPKGHQFYASWTHERLVSGIQLAEDPRWTKWLACATKKAGRNRGTADRLL